MPRSPNRIREDERRAAEDASPRVGSVHRNRMCARCGASTLVTRMKVARRGQYHLFYATRTAAADIEVWLCEPCSKALQNYGVLRAA